MGVKKLHKKNKRLSKILNGRNGIRRGKTIAKKVKKILR